MSTFTFDNKLYKQIDGVAMGSPFGLTLIKAFLCSYEKIWLNDCPPQFKPVIYRCHVDDIWAPFLFCLNLKNF